MDRVASDRVAGNAYLGGYVAGLSLSGGDPYEGEIIPIHRVVKLMGSAALYATVSASFAVEQLGLPVLSTENFDSSEGLWNDDRPKRRLDELRERVKCEAIRG